jgi:calcium release-activated calcium channel protein 1
MRGFYGHRLPPMPTPSLGRPSLTRPIPILDVLTRGKQGRVRDVAATYHLMATVAPTALDETLLENGAGSLGPGGLKGRRRDSDDGGYLLGRAAGAGPVPSTDEILIGKQKVALVANVSALIAGFTVVALVELSVPDAVPDELTAVYSLLSTVLIVIHMFATLVSVCILPTLELMLHHLAATPEEGGPVREQYRRYRFFVDIAWTCSMGLGILLFLTELIVVVWVKLGHISFLAAAVTTAFLVLMIVIFLAFGAILRNREGAFLTDMVKARRQRLDASAALSETLT